MSLGHAVAALAADTKLFAVLSIVAVDVVLGVLAALKRQDFHFAKVALFARDDILGKVAPWAFLDVAAMFVPKSDVDLGTFAVAAYALVIAALAGSLTSSLADLGLPLPAQFAKGERT